MPSQPNDQDPIVQILQLAARRGFEIMRQREQQADTTPLTHDALHGEEGIGNGGANRDSRDMPAKDTQDASTNS